MYIIWHFGLQVANWATAKAQRYMRTMQDVVIRTGSTERQPKRYARFRLRRRTQRRDYSFWIRFAKKSFKILFKIIQNTFGLLFNSLALSLFVSSSVTFAPLECCACAIHAVHCTSSLCATRGPGFVPSCALWLRPLPGKTGNAGQSHVNTLTH